MDEPLSALDAKIRVSLRDDIRSIQRELGITTIFVTHDQEEALSISDRVVVMYQGRADQIGVPAEIDNRPATRFVAGFVGHLNTFEAQVGENGAVRFAGHSLPGKAATLRAGAAVTVALRPEALSLAPRNGDDLRVEGRVLHTNFRARRSAPRSRWPGRRCRSTCSTSPMAATCHSPDRPGPCGSRVMICWCCRPERNPGIGQPVAPAVLFGTQIDISTVRDPERGCWDSLMSCVSRAGDPLETHQKFVSI